MRGVLKSRSDFGEEWEAILRGELARHRGKKSSWRSAVSQQ